MIPRRRHAGRSFPATAAGVLVALGPVSAEAHLVNTGMGPVYDGISHFILSPWDVAIIAGLAIFAAMRGARAGRMTLLALPAAFLAAAIVGHFFPSAPDPAWLRGAALLLVGLLLAADLRLPLAIVAAIAAVISGYAGFLTGTEYATASAESLMLAGTSVAMIIIATLAAGTTVAIARSADWHRIALRVLGSWCAAIGLLMLGWALRVR